MRHLAWLSKMLKDMNSETKLIPLKWTKEFKEQRSIIEHLEWVSYCIKTISTESINVSLCFVSFLVDSSFQGREIIISSQIPASQICFVLSVHQFNLIFHNCVEIVLEKLPITGPKNVITFVIELPSFLRQLCLKIVVH